MFSLDWNWMIASGSTHDLSLPEIALSVDKENSQPPRDPEFRTPLLPTKTAPRSRTLSTLKMNLTPRPNRTSLILRHLSPEEG